MRKMQKLFTAGEVLNVNMITERSESDFHKFTAKYTESFSLFEHLEVPEEALLEEAKDLLEFSETF